MKIFVIFQTPFSTSCSLIFEILLLKIQKVTIKGAISWVFETFELNFGWVKNWKLWGKNGPCQTLNMCYTKVDKDTETQNTTFYSLSQGQQKI